MLTINISTFPKRFYNPSGGWPGGWLAGWESDYIATLAQPTGFSHRSECLVGLGKGLGLGRGWVIGWGWVVIGLGWG